jgi:hypothetical protein
MNNIFDYFPQDNYDFLLIYEQCKKTTSAMAKNPSIDNFKIYSDRCKDPLTDLKNTIDSDYTVKVQAYANPNN